MIGGLIGRNLIQVGGTSNISNVHATGNVTGTDGIGGLIGSNDSINSSNVSISNAYATGNVKGDIFVGGLLGYSGANNGTVGISNVYATGNVNGRTYIGGLVGYYLALNDTASISNAYATGNVKGERSIGGLVGSHIAFNGTASISNAYATGNVQGDNFIGGLVGDQSATNGAASVSNSYWDSETTGQSTSAGGGAPRTSAQMKRLDTFAEGQGGWDISAQGASNAIWRIYEGQTAPLLRSFLTPVTISDTETQLPSVYNGSTVHGGVAYAALTIGDTDQLKGTLSYDAPSKNTGTYSGGTLKIGGLYSTQQGYDISYAGPAIGSLFIAPKALTATAMATNKVYDGNDTAVTAPVLTLAGLIGDETVTATGTGIFDSKNVKDATKVTVNSVRLLDGANGGLASNYSLGRGQTAGAKITPKVLTASPVAGSADKIYNGNDKATASLNIVSGLIEGETLVGTGTGAFNSKNVRDASSVTLDRVALADGEGGGLASNYELTPGGLVGGAQMAAVITPKVLIASTVAGSADKIYNGDDKATASLNIVSGLIEGETLVGTGTGTFNSKNVRDASSVTLDRVALANGEGGLASNYDLALGGLVNGPQMAAVITPKVLTASPVAGSADKTYNGDDKATANLEIVAGLIEGETLVGTGTGTFNSKNVRDASSVTLDRVALANGEGGGLASNYELGIGGLAGGPQMKAVITPKAEPNPDGGAGTPGTGTPGTGTPGTPGTGTPGTGTPGTGTPGTGTPGTGTPGTGTPGTGTPGTGAPGTGTPGTGTPGTGTPGTGTPGTGTPGTGTPGTGTPGTGTPGTGTTPDNNAGPGTASGSTMAIPVEVLVTVENTIHGLEGQAPGAPPPLDVCFNDAYAVPSRTANANGPYATPDRALPVYAHVGGAAPLSSCTSSPAL